MLLATSNEQIRTQGLRGALERCLRPAVGFDHPRDVLKDPHLSLIDKRAILASWASDASSVALGVGLVIAHFAWMGVAEPMPISYGVAGTGLDMLGLR